MKVCSLVMQSGTVTRCIYKYRTLFDWKLGFPIGILKNCFMDPLLQWRLCFSEIRDLKGVLYDVFQTPDQVRQLCFAFLQSGIRRSIQVFSLFMNTYIIGMKHRYTVMFTSYTVKSYCLTREQNCITCPRPPNNSKTRACILPSNPVNEYFIVHFQFFLF